eukprot:218826_1
MDQEHHHHHHHHNRRMSIKDEQAPRTSLLVYPEQSLLKNCCFCVSLDTGVKIISVYIILSSAPEILGISSKAMLALVLPVVIFNIASGVAGLIGAVQRRTAPAKILFWWLIIAAIIDLCVFIVAISSYVPEEESAPQATPTASAPQATQAAGGDEMNSGGGLGFLRIFRIFRGPFTVLLKCYSAVIVYSFIQQIRSTVDAHRQSRSYRNMQEVPE